MKHMHARHTVAIALAVTLLGCQDGLGPDGAGYPDLPELTVTLTGEQRTRYEDDAVRLAVRHLEATRSRHRDAVDPPAALVSSLYNALLAVHASEGAARDSVIDVHRIRAFPNPPVYEILVAIDPAVPWTEAWRNRVALTGNETIDALVQEYGLTIPVFYDWSFDQVALVRAARPINTKALAKRIARVNGVKYAEGNGYMGDGADIRTTLQAGGWVLEYSIGFGDCPAGCIGRYAWRFRVAPGGTVQFLGTSGTPPGSH